MDKHTKNSKTIHTCAQGGRGAMKVGQADRQGEECYECRYCSLTTHLCAIDRCRMEKKKIVMWKMRVYGSCVLLFWAREDALFVDLDSLIVWRLVPEGGSSEGVLKWDNLDLVSFQFLINLSKEEEFKLTSPLCCRRAERSNFKHLQQQVFFSGQISDETFFWKRHVNDQPKSTGLELVLKCDSD